MRKLIVRYAPTPEKKLVPILSGEWGYVLLCTNATGDEKLVAWTLAEPHPVRLEAKLTANAEVTAVRRNVEVYSPTLEPERLVLDLDAVPKYVKLRNAKLAK